MDLNGKVAWITGGARMGLPVARVLSKDGCKIAFTYHSSKQPADDAAKAIKAEGGDAFVLQCDLTEEQRVNTAVDEIVKHFGRLDILVNLASIYEEGQWDAHMKTNAESAYVLTNAVAPAMTRAGGGRIVHIADWTSASGRPRYKKLTPYYVSKAAIKAIVEGTALELAPTIQVNAIAPGPILPPKGMTPQEEQTVIEATPLKRWGGAEEIAKAVQFLCQTDFMTGETIRVDGGRHLY